MYIYRSDAQRWVWTVVLVAAAFAVGYLATTSNPVWLVGGALLALYAVFAFVQFDLAVLFTALLLPIFPPHFAIRVSEALPQVTMPRIMLAVLLVSWLLRDLFRRRDPRPRNPVLMPMLVVLGVWTISTLMSISPSTSLKNLLHWVVECFAVFVVLGDTIQQKNLVKTMFGMWLVAATLIAGIAIGEFNTQQNLFSSVPVAEGVFVDQRIILRGGYSVIRVMFGNHIELGAFLVMALFLGLYLSRICPRGSRQTAIYLSCLVIAIAIALTMARGAYLGLMGGLLVLSKDKRRLWLVLATALALLVFLDQTGLIAALLGFGTGIADYAGFRGSMLGRWGLIKFTLQSLPHLPVFGRGPATHNLRPPLPGISADTLFMILSFDVGIMGLLAVLLLLTSVGWVLWMSIKNREHDNLYWLGLTALAVLIAYSLVSFSSMGLLMSSPLNSLFWGILGIVVYALRREDGDRSTI